MPYWIAESLSTLPAFLWMYIGVGGALALAMLPRAERRDALVVLAAAIPLGAAAVTAWLFVLGVLGAQLGSPLLHQPALVFAGTAAWFALGVGIIARRCGLRADIRAWRRPVALRLDERVLVLVVAAALLVRWLVIAYWPFTAYDTLWVYGSQARLYFVQGVLPNSIDYYPQFMQLQYLYGMLAYGGISDHAARAGLIVLHLGSVLAAYTLGARLFSRRVGLYAAAIWALYPHVGEWARAGDLEIALAQMMALAAALLLRAWYAPLLAMRSRLHLAAVAGLLLGIGLWTKPTMGAFVYGMAALAAVEWARARLRIPVAWPRWRLLIVCGLAAAPLGGVWYIRNLLLGHAAVDFPPAYWLTQAARSGAEFGWPALAVLVYLAFVALAPSMQPYRRLIRWPLLLAALVALCLALLPSILTPRRMLALEWLALLAGAGLLVAALLPHARAAWRGRFARDAERAAGALLLALPYFVTWFYSYSYHPRLSFAIVPLLLLPTAVLLARGLREWVPAQRRRLALRVALLLALAGIPGVVGAVYDPNEGWGYLASGALPNDHARYTSGNQALMNVVDGLQAWIDAHPRQTLVTYAPGIDRLPFFFPRHRIEVDQVPLTIEAVGDAPYFVYGVPETRGAYEFIPPQDAPLLGALGRTDLVRRAWGLDDGLFRYDVYELHFARRFGMPFINAPSPDAVVAGEPAFATYLGHDLGGLDFWAGRRVIAHIFWQVQQPAAGDYDTHVELLGPDGNVAAVWAGPTAHTALGYYSTLHWTPGEIVSDERLLVLPDPPPPAGAGYALRIRLTDRATGQTVPLRVNGEHADGYVIENRIVVVPPPA